MDVEDFKRLGEDLFGNGWQTRLSRALGVDASSVRRWVGSAVPVPPTVSAFLLMMADRQEVRGALSLERLPLGRPVHVETPDPVILQWMEQRFVFPGVDQAKPMPAISARREGDVLLLSLDGSPFDRIGADDLSYSLVRHPDSKHLSGFLAAAAVHGHQAAVVSHRFHHYALIAHQDGACRVFRRIHTHAGEVRTLTSPSSDSASVTPP